MRAERNPLWEPCLPFDLVEGNDNHGPYITTNFGTTICDFYCMSDPSSWAVCNGGTSKPIWFTDAAEHAAFMAKAANAYGELVAGLREVFDRSFSTEQEAVPEIRRVASGLLAKHGGAL